MHIVFWVSGDFSSTSQTVEIYLLLGESNFRSHWDVLGFVRLFYGVEVVGTLSTPCSPSGREERGAGEGWYGFSRSWVIRFRLMSGKITHP